MFCDLLHDEQSGNSILDKGEKYLEIGRIFYHFLPEEQPISIEKI